MNQVVELTSRIAAANVAMATAEDQRRHAQQDRDAALRELYVDHGLSVPAILRIVPAGSPGYDRLRQIVGTRA